MLQMRNPVWFFASLFFLLFLVFWPFRALQYGVPPYGDEEISVPRGLDNFPDLINWKRPIGPPKVGIQAGHWKNDELPDELEKIRGNGGATSRSGVTEWEVNLAIAQSAAKVLREKGVVVDILPATVPEKYWADVFISIHADGNLNPMVAGYKVAAPWRDFTGRAGELVTLLEQEYEKGTGLVQDPNITRNMRGYYAFSWWRFDHAIHPMTTAAIVETGFLSNPSNARMLINNSNLPAEAISRALLNFLKIS